MFPRASRVALALLACALLAWPADARARGRRPGATPRTTRAPETSLDAVLSKAPPSACRDQVRGELVSGGRIDDRCEGTRTFATQALLRTVPRDFGVVELRQVQLVGIRLVLSAAKRCRAWVLRSPGRLVARPDDAARAGCELKRHRGPVPLFVVAPDGTRTATRVLQADEDGRVELSFARIDAELRAANLGGLDGFARLEIGEGAWAGAVDLSRLRRLIAEWHFSWVRAGRGSPALFVARHPGHERSGSARALAVEATLARQERDYLAVSRGELSAEAFLRRHAWSPYRRSVTTLSSRAYQPGPVAGAAGAP